MKIGPSIPFHALKAYGASAPAATSEPVSSGLDRAELSSRPIAASSQRPATNAARLIAAVVPGRIDFSGDTPVQKRPTDSLAMYQRPADKNAAATAVYAGRMIDVRG